jgi:hypothetical protein
MGPARADGAPRLCPAGAQGAEMTATPGHVAPPDLAGVADVAMLQPSAAEGAEVTLDEIIAGGLRCRDVAQERKPGGRGAREFRHVVFEKPAILMANLPPRRATATYPALTVRPRPAPRPRTPSRGDP